MNKVPVSVVVITRNEEDNIAECLRSAAWADEIVVLDDYSSDNTVNIARQFTDKVFERKMDIEGRHRNYAYSLANNIWVLSLDADERIAPQLAEEIKTLLKTTPKDRAYTVPIKTYIGKRWIEHGGWYPAPKVRLFDKRTFRYEEAVVHPRVFHDGTCGHLKGDIVHYSYKDFHDYFISLNNQTTLEAKKWFGERRKMNFLKMWRKAVSRFLKSYIQKGAYRDGLLGFMVAYGSGLYQLMSYVKYREMLEVAEKDKKKVP
jgi:glycosyltransferase involved in cell wall biosynthesis